MRDHGRIFTGSRHHRQHASGGNIKNFARYRRKPERPSAGIGRFDHELAIDPIKQRSSLSGMPLVATGKFTALQKHIRQHGQSLHFPIRQRIAPEFAFYKLIPAANHKTHEQIRLRRYIRIEFQLLLIDREP